jgi:vacuolar-type H+-ATPase catalytic subunit A/Vma1
MLNELLKLNKRNFWRTIKRKRKKSVNTTLPISEIKKEFEELFNTLSEMKTEKDEKIENKTKERYENIKNTHIVE